MGASGIAQDTRFSASRYAYRFDLTAWGWIHLGDRSGTGHHGPGSPDRQELGRGAGVVVAGISLITQFMFVPYYPLWAIPAMTLDLLILFALTRVHIETRGGR